MCYTNRARPADGLRLGSLWLLLLIGTLSGCAATAHKPSAPAPMGLNTWVDTRLAPYLAEELGRHPRFKGEPVLLVAMDGDEVEPDIDRLTAELRSRVTERLAETAGVNLAWRPASRPWSHQRRLADVRCGEDRALRYYIGIDLSQPREGEAQVLVRALDPVAGQWLSGFGRSWRGPLDPEQAESLRQQSVDEHLRGLRPLPFTSNQADLVAAYLARNLTCLLQQRADDRLVVFREPVAARPAFFRTTMDLVVNYLSRFHEVEVTEQKDRANVILEGQLHHIDADLYQLWVVTQFSDSAERLAGADTDVYVRLRPTAVPVAASTATNPVAPRAGRPPVTVAGSSAASAGTKASSHPPTVVVAGPSAATAALGHRPPPAAIDRLRPAAGPVAQPVLAAFDVVAPVSPSLCHTATPWVMGERSLGRNPGLDGDGCFALRLTPKQPAWVFLLHRDPKGVMTRLLPSDCPTASGGRLSAGQPLRFPDFSHANGPVIRLVDEAGTETFTALATGDRGQADRLRQLLAHIPSACGAGGGADGAYWIARIGRLLREAKGKVEKSDVSVRHPNP